MKDRKPKAIAPIDPQRAASLVYPIAAFMHAGGMSDQAALEVFAAALKAASKASGRRKIEHIAHPSLYAEIVATWMRNKKFLTKSGWPRPLTFSGPLGFTGLVRAVGQRTDPRYILSVMMRYGNVMRTRRGEYVLTRPFFDSSGPKSFAYEPVASFLSDASATLGKILKRSKYSRGRGLFWQKTDNARIPDSEARRFMAFAKERSLVFLEEMDEWLAAHSEQPGSPRSKCRRVGLGIFSIHSDRESSRTQS